MRKLVGSTNGLPRVLEVTPLFPIARVSADLSPETLQHRSLRVTQLARRLLGHDGDGS
jgi:hypothetical protein